MEFEEVYEGQQVCCTCKHYFQHYRHSGEKYLLVGWGHCTCPRIKARKPDGKCERWEGKKEDPVGES